ncbi:MAG TPA: hypothetical protein VFD47_09350, partial [Actinomycetota bacterium]|nr:hypothetical protein [Actinomycetota bacterium]
MSSSASMRSRAVSLPRSCCRATACSPPAAQTAHIEDRIAELEAKKAEARTAGGEQAVARQH